MSPNTLLAYSAATLVLLVIPGPAVMYIVTRSAAQGRRAGLVSVAGIHVGTIVHVLAAMIGLSAVLAASATAFTIVKFVGAAYLIWLGVQSIRAYRLGSVAETTQVVEERALRRVFIDGAVLNVLNPKTAIFFLSFVPQFVDPGTTGAYYRTPHIAAQSDGKATIAFVTSIFCSRRRSATVVRFTATC
jgi:threonine/homoserine/homoserine lactone efflux protein